MKVNKSIQYNQRAKNPIQVLSKITDTEWQESISNSTCFNQGTKRNSRRGGCYKGDGRSYVNCGNRSELRINYFKLDFYFIKSANGILLLSNGTHTVSGWWCRQLGANYHIFRFASFATNDAANFFDLDTTSINVGEIIHVIITTKINEVIIKANDLSVTFHNFTGIKYVGSESFYINQLQGNTSDYSDTYIWGIKFDKLTAGGSFVENLLFYKCDENSGADCYDSSGNGYHGQIINAITDPPETNLSSIHHYQNVYSWHNQFGYSQNGNIYIPRNESITTIPFKDVLGNNLQFFGHAQNNLPFTNSYCFRGDQAGQADEIWPIWSSPKNLDFSFYANLSQVDSNILCGSININSKGLIIEKNNNDIIARGNNYSVSVTLNDLEIDNVYIRVEYINTTNTLNLTVNTTTNSVNPGLSDIYSDERFCLLSYIENSPFSQPLGNNILIYNLKGSIDTFIFNYPLCEPIINISNHKYYDVSGNNNHITLTNGSVVNQGVQDYFHYLIIKGYTKKIDDVIVPALDDLSGNDAEGNILNYAQNGSTFLNCGTRLKQNLIPEIINNDTENLFFDVNQNAIELSFQDLIFGTKNNKYYTGNIDYTQDKISNLVIHPTNLKNLQHLTELRVRRAFENISFETLIFELNQNGYSQGQSNTVPRAGVWANGLPANDIAWTESKTQRFRFDLTFTITNNSSFPVSVTDEAIVVGCFNNNGTSDVSIPYPNYSLNPAESEIISVNSHTSLFSVGQTFLGTFSRVTDYLEIDITNTTQNIIPYFRIEKGADTVYGLSVTTDIQYSIAEI